MITTMFALMTGSSALAAPSATTYDSVDDSTSASLRSTLHDVIDNHTRYPYTSSSTDVWDIINDADEDPSDANAILDVYKNETYTKIPGGTGAYNREHAWPKSLGFPSSGSVPYTDAHHLFASDAQYNSARGNKYFDDCNGTAWPTASNHGVGGAGESNYACSASFEPWDEVKGDLARAMFYMDVRYSGDTGSEPDLVLTDNASLIQTTSGGTAYMGLLSTLLAWHHADPVDAREEDRNDIIEYYQGNRNPFVDHPEWAACLFEGTDCGGGVGSDPTVTALSQSGISGSAGSWTNFTVDLPSGATNLVVTMSGGHGDGDLYTRYGSSYPTTSSYDCRPYLDGNDETCTDANPPSGKLWISIRGYSSFSGVRVVVHYDP